jgi:hypothetical protein
MHQPLTFSSTGQPGYSPAVLAFPNRVRARKHVREIKVDFARREAKVRTPEGTVHAAVGDAILTGSMGERWCMPADRFARKYTPVPPTVAGQSGRYSSVPIEIVAVPMREKFEVILLDGISRLRGHLGDWLVDYGDGSLGVVAQRIFTATYDVIG